MSSQEVPATTKKVCFICGSYTSLTINIYEQRCGPNIVDVINQKFKVQPLSEDRFLCYSCNNWLINWHSLQNKNEPTASTTAAAAGSGHNRTNKNKSKINQSIPEEQINDECSNYSNKQDNYNYYTEDELRLRIRLQKYFYYPKQENAVLSNHKQGKINNFYNNKTCLPKCRFCYYGKSRRRFQRPNRITMRKYCQKCKRKLEQFNSIRNQNKKDQISDNIENEDCNFSSQLILVNPYVVSRLNKLGTTVEREGSTSSISSSSSSSSSQQQKHHMQDNDLFIINKNDRIDQQHVTQSFENTTKTNEILMAFNTVLTEVYSIPDTQCNVYESGGKKEEVTNGCLTSVCGTIIQNLRIPKSLSITLLAK